MPGPALAPPGELPAPVAPSSPTPPPPTEPYVEPTPAPAAPVEAPAVAASGAADTGAAAPVAEGADADEEKLAWRGTSLSWDHSITKNTLVKDWQPQYNPTYVQTLNAGFRWYFTDSLSFRLRQGMAVELTDSDGDTEKQQLLFNDTRLDVVESKLYEWEEVVLSVGIGVRLPLSLTSQAEERIAGVGPTVGVGRKFDVLDGLSVDVSGGYRHNFGLSNVKHTESPYPCKTLSECDQASGVTNTRDSFSVGLDGSLGFLDDFSFGIGGASAWSLGYDLADSALVGEDQSTTHWRNSVDFHASLGYGPWKWLGIDLGMATITSHQDLFPARGADGRNPIWNPDTTLSLTFTLGIDELYLAADREPSATASSEEHRLATQDAASGT